MAHHAVCLKVLRLTPPSNTGSDVLLQLPASFGTIYQSEYFTALVSLKLEHATIVLNPKLVLQFQSPSQLELHQKTTLHTLQAQQLHPNSSQLDSIVHHPIHQLGLHSLICTVSYEEPILLDQDTLSHDQTQRQPSHGDENLATHQTQTQTRSFRKLYKFQALNPLSIKTKIFMSESQKYGRPENNTHNPDRLIDILNQLILVRERSKGDTGDDADQQNQKESILDHTIDLFKNYLNRIRASYANGYFIEISIQNQALKPLDLNLKIIDPELDVTGFSALKVTDFSHNFISTRSPSSIIQTNTQTQPESLKEEEYEIKNTQLNSKQETQHHRISPGDIYQYSLKIEQLIVPGESKNQREIKIKTDQDNEKEEDHEDQNKQDEEKDLKLEINFTGVTGESGRLIKNLAQMINTSSQHQHHAPASSSPSPTSGHRVQYISPDLDMMMMKNSNSKGKSNQLFRFEVTQYPSQNTIKIGSKIQVRFKLSIDLKSENDQVLRDLLIWILNSKLKNLTLTLPVTNNSSIAIASMMSKPVSRLVLLNSLPLQPILADYTNNTTENFQEYQLDYQIIAPLLTSSRINVTHSSIIKQKGNIIDLNVHHQSFLDLGRISTGSSDLDFLFSIPNHSIGSVFSPF